MQPVNVVPTEAAVPVPLVPSCKMHQHLFVKPSSAIEVARRAQRGKKVGTYLVPSMGGITTILKSLQSRQFDGGHEKGLRSVKHKVGSMIGRINRIRSWKVHARCTHKDWREDEARRSAANDQSFVATIRTVASGL